MNVPDTVADPYVMKSAAQQALAYARYYSPKLSGISAERMEAIWGRNYFGVKWADNYVWFQEVGINPFTMKSLAGKTIPMWVLDKDGSLLRDNPKIKQRTTADGRHQVLIFRRAAHVGQRKQAPVASARKTGRATVPMSYPGAPGRINKRIKGSVTMGRGRVGQIAKTNVGVRWRHPGLAPRSFLHRALLETARDRGYPLSLIRMADEKSLPTSMEQGMTMVSSVTG